jgi:ketosteroid isomerase-like protein
MTSHFATAEEAQQVFYQAIERADLAQMMTVWAEDDDIVCIHPGGPRHTGIEEVRESWRRIFHCLRTRWISAGLRNCHQHHRHQHICALGSWLANATASRIAHP